MTPTPVFNTGFEAGLVSGSNGSGLGSGLSGSAAVQSSVKHNGTYALQIPCVTGTAATWAPQAYVTGTKIAWRGYFYKHINPSAALRVFQTTPLTNCILTMKLQTTGTLQLSWGGSGVSATVDGGLSAVLASDTWNQIEIIWDVSSASFAAYLRVNGVDVSTNCTATTAGAGTSVSFTLGCNATTLSATVDTYWDDQIVGTAASTSDWWGAGKGFALRPASDGTHSMTANDMAFGDAGANITNATTTVSTVLVDDPWSTTRSTTDAVRQAVIRTTSYCEVVCATTAETLTANAVEAYLAYSATTTTADTGGCVIRNTAGTAVTVWGGQGTALSDYSETSNFFKAAQATPQSSWTPTEVNALRFRFGYSDDVTPPPTWQALLLEVDSPVLPANTVAPVASGTQTLGSTLTTDDGTWTGGPNTFTYQWQRDNSGGGSYSNIGGATASTHVIVAADHLCNVRCNVVATNSFGSAAAVASNVLGPMALLPVNTVAPVASGTQTLGSTLSTTDGTWTNTPTSFTYQWQRNDGGAGAYQNIAAQTAATKTIVAADHGFSVRCQVTAINAAGSSASSTPSNALGPMALLPVNTVAPVASGTATQGSTVSTTTGTWTNTPTSYTYQWQRNDGGAGAYADIASATSSTYVLAHADVGYSVRCQVTAVNAAGSSAAAASSNVLGTVGALAAGSIAAIVAATSL